MNGAIIWQADSAPFFSDSAWTVNGLNAGAIAERCASPDSVHSNSRKDFRSSIRHRPSFECFCSTQIGLAVKANLAIISALIGRSIS